MGNGGASKGGKGGKKRGEGGGAQGMTIKQSTYDGDGGGRGGGGWQALEVVGCFFSWYDCITIFF